MKIKNILSILLFCVYSLSGQVNIEKRKVFELTLSGPANGNSYLEIKLSGLFTKDNDTISLPGFYDGDGVYKIRFMPQKEGKWNYETIDRWEFSSAQVNTF